MGHVEVELECAVKAAAAATSMNDFGAALPHVPTALGASRVLQYRYPEPERFIPAAADLTSIVDDYTENLYRQDFCHQTSRRLKPKPRIVRDHQPNNRSQHLTSAPYNECYRQYDIDHFACISLTSAPHAQLVIVSLLIGHARQQGDSTTRASNGCRSRCRPSSARSSA